MTTKGDGWEALAARLETGMLADLSGSKARTVGVRVRGGKRAKPAGARGAVRTRGGVGAVGAGDREPRATPRVVVIVDLPAADPRPGPEQIAALAGCAADRLDIYVVERDTAAIALVPRALNPDDPDLGLSHQLVLSNLMADVVVLAPGSPTPEWAPSPARVVTWSPGGEEP